MGNDPGQTNLAELEERLASTPLHGLLRYFPTTASTQTLALEAAARGERAGVWIADEQTAGRGRGGHSWHSAPGDGLYLTVLLRPSLPLAWAPAVPLAAGLAAGAAVASVTGRHCDIRWPNDLMLGERKFGGILVESAVSPPPRQEFAESPHTEAMLRYVAVGIGLNVAHQAFPPELQETATSLLLQGVPSVNRASLLAEVLLGCLREVESLEFEASLAPGQPAEGGLLHRFAAASSWVHGKRVEVGEDGGYTGTTAGLDGRGFLLVDVDDGTRRTVLSGGVREPADSSETKAGM